MAQMYRIGKHATSVFDDDGVMTVVYHDTAVVRFDEKKIILASGGWETQTTKTRMNQASNQFGLGYSVFQRNFEWFVEWKGEILPFHSGMVLKR